MFDMNAHLPSLESWQRPSEMGARYACIRALRTTISVHVTTHSLNVVHYMSSPCRVYLERVSFFGLTYIMPTNSCKKTV
jgi:hypothetical protein